MESTKQLQLVKMPFINSGSEASVKPNYFLKTEGGNINLNDAIGQRLTLNYSGVITCISCGKRTKTSFGQGYCYPCFTKVPQTEECVLKPELCRAHQGIARDMEYAKEHCLTDQFVYLALSGGLKVGVTRFHQVPTRWVDQGACWAIKIAIAENRYTAGLLEVYLKKFFADKTNWRKMLTSNDELLPLEDKKQLAMEQLALSGIPYRAADDTIYSIEYPVAKFPTKVASKDLEKQPTVEGTLVGIKGQYLLFENGDVLNIRKHSGYNLEISIG